MTSDRTAIHKKMLFSTTKNHTKMKNYHLDLQANNVLANRIQIVLLSLLSQRIGVKIGIEGASSGEI